MQLEIFYPNDNPQEPNHLVNLWSGYQPGPCWEMLMDLQDKMLDKTPFTASESKIWKDHQFAPKGYKYDTYGNLYSVVF